MEGFDDGHEGFKNMDGDQKVLVYSIVLLECSELLL
jgi:hypothetical protein